MICLREKLAIFRSITSGHRVRRRLLALKPLAIAPPRPSKANAEARPRAMPSKIVQWTVVGMTFLNGQPSWQRHVDWPVGDRVRAGGDVAKHARHETIVEDHLTATYLYTWSAVR